MAGDISVGSDSPGSDALDAADNTTVDFPDSTVDDTRADRQTDPSNEMQAVADQLRGQIGSSQAKTETRSSLVREGFEERARSLDDVMLDSEIKNTEALITERDFQLNAAQNTEENAGTINKGLGLLSGAVSFGSAYLGQGAAIANGLFGLSSTGFGEEVISFVAGNSADVAFDIKSRLDAELQVLNNEKQRRAEQAPPNSGHEVTGEIPERPDVTESLPEQIAAERNTAEVEREKQQQLENIAANDPAFREQALQEAANAADRATAAEQRADQLQQQQDEKVNELAAAEERLAAKELREQQQRDRDDRSEPNGGQVGHADPGVGHNDVPDSF